MATWTTAVHDWSSGEKPTAALMDAQLRDLANSMGAWGSYTPALSGTGWAIGNGTAVGYFSQTQKTVRFRGTLTFGSSSTFGGSQAYISYPVTTNANAQVPLLYVAAYDSSASTWYRLDYVHASTTTFTPKTVGTLGVMANVISTSPFTWATGDLLYFAGQYEAA